MPPAIVRATARGTGPSGADHVAALQIGRHVGEPESGHERLEVCHRHLVAAAHIDAAEHHHEGAHPACPAGWYYSTVQDDPERRSAERSPGPRRAVASAIWSAICCP